MKKGLLYGMALIGLLTGCNTPPQGPVEYRTAEGYFVRNDVPDRALNLKIDAKEEFGKYFGMGATMTQLPSEIDFSKAYAAAVILPATDRSMEIHTDSVISSGGNLYLYYSVHTGARQSYTLRPFELIILDRKYGGNLTFVANKAIAEDSGSDYIGLKLQDGKASATISKAADQRITFAFEAAGNVRLHGTLSSPDSLANLRFTQIYLPDGSADGPFGREIEYDLPQQGLYKLIVGENMMAGDPWAGTFTIHIEVSSPN